MDELERHLRQQARIIEQQDALIRAQNAHIEHLTSRSVLRMPLADSRTAVRDTTDEAIEAAYQAADQDWKERALAVVKHIAQTQEFSAPDDVWKYIEKPREPRALGGVMLRAARMGWIEKTGQMKVTDQVTQHRNMVNVWRSLLYQGVRS